MKIRNANKQDISGILEIFNYEIIHTAAVYCYEPYSMEMMTNWYDEKMYKNYPLLIAEVDGRVAGYATYGQFRDRPAYKFCHEHSVYIHKDFRRKGIAQKMMSSLIELAKKNEVHTLVGGIDATNVESIKFHQKFGFTEVAHMKEVAYKFDQWLDLKFFQLIL